MVRKYHPDLDLLDSPLVSPTPLTSVGGIPGSAIAEKIFNDPDSWDNPLAQDTEATDPKMSWFAEQVEKLKGLSVGADDRSAILSMEQSDLILCTFQDRPKTPQKEVANPAAVSSQEGSRKSKARKSADVIWEARGRQPAALSPLCFSPPSSSEGSEDFSFLHIVSPLAATPPSTKAAPASATWSFLELYGIQPDTPRKPPIQAATVKPKEPRPRCTLQGPMTSHVPPKPPTSPPKVPLPPVPPQTALPQADSSKASSSSLFRRLPAPPPTEPAEENALLSRASVPALPTREPPAVSHANSARVLSEQWTSTPSSTPSPSGPRMPSVRSPPPAGPRPKGFTPQTRRTLSRSPPRILASRPPPLNL